jgi:hypothetical protein
MRCLAWGRCGVKSRPPTADRYRFLEFTDQYAELLQKGQSYLGIGTAIAREGVTGG